MAKKPTIVCVPALLCDSRLYQGVKTSLQDDFDVVLADTVQDSCVDAMARRLLAVAPDRFVLAGNSLGGYVALQVMLLAPERVSHLMLMGTNAHADSHEARQRREQAIRLAEGGKFMSFVDGYVEGALSPHGSKAAAPVLEAMARALGPKVLISQQRAIMGRPDMMRHLKDFHVPATVLYGEADHLSPLAAHEDMAEGLPNAELEILPECGHLIPLEQPEAVAISLRRLMAR
ncbi:alpha/beta fold hydrolase [Kordiimonas marina]|uniref:alpha/beta fold hydrolase n=1 Tax=Kordiimonas marina TaxID=2872312 RepID=UPI001FF0F736|nr:alpha/beta fold hydrolase [Kordiimonas marina]MCJ9430425.1 alpha/beta hydrolase [Kordiimonas marina]